MTPPLRGWLRHWESPRRRFYPTLSMLTSFRLIRRHFRKTRFLLMTFGFSPAFGAASALHTQHHRRTSLWLSGFGGSTPRSFRRDRLMTDHTKQNGANKARLATAGAVAVSMPLSNSNLNRVVHAPSRPSGAS